MEIVNKQVKQVTIQQVKYKCDFCDTVRSHLYQCCYCARHLCPKHVIHVQSKYNQDDPDDIQCPDCKRIYDEYEVKFNKLHEDIENLEAERDKLMLKLGDECREKAGKKT